MPEITEQLLGIRMRIRRACEKVGRSDDSVRLVAVSKTFPAEDMREAVAAGQRCFGESRLQEAEPKAAELPADLDWHFIGHVQRNKVRKILPLFGCVHAVDSLKLAVYMDGVAKDLGLMPEVFLQVDQAGEESKGGFSPLELRRALPALTNLQNLRIAGLMTIPPAAENPEDSRRWFRELRELRDELAEGFSPGLPSLSMGMSGDFEIAVEEGATHVRVGSLIFGRRDHKTEGELGYTQ
jgi:pyridoxal phosphate enzyme (YggS family)